MSPALCLLLALASFPVGAATPPPAEPGGRDDRVRTVILGLVPRRSAGSADDKQLAAALTDIMQGIYAEDLRRIVIGRDDIGRVLDLEAEKQSLGCDSEKCLAEVGQALDAARIVTGSLDQLGDSFMVTMSEIDAKTLEAVARVQERVAKDENKLVDAVQRLARDLLRKAALKQTSTNVNGFARAGSLEVETEPRGARIVLGGTELGSSPSKIDNLATGSQRLRLLRDDYQPIELDVPIYAGGTTKVNAQMRINRALAEQNLQVRQERWRDANQWHAVGTWTKLGIGGVVSTVGALFGINSFVRGDPGTGIVGLALIGGAGAGVLAWGVVDLVNPPDAPVAEWDIERKVTVTPPPDQAPVQVQVLQEGKQTAER